MAIWLREMLTTLTPLVRGGHAASEQLTIVRTEASMPTICGSYSTFFMALPHSVTVDADWKQFDYEVADRPICPLGLFIMTLFWRMLYLRQSTTSKSLLATPVRQVTEMHEAGSTASRSNNVPDSYTQSGSRVTGSWSDVTSKMAAPLLDQNTVTCLYQALESMPSWA